MKISHKFIGKNVREIRKRRGMEQWEMAKLLGMNEKSYELLESGGYIPSLYKMVGICSMLNVTPNYLLANVVPDKEISDGFESGFIRYRAASYRREHNLTMQEMGEILKMSEKEYQSFEISTKPLTRGQTMNIEFLLVRQEKKQASAMLQKTATA